MNLRRYRLNKNVRNLLNNHWINVNNFFQPIFVCEDLKDREAIVSMPGVYNDTIKTVLMQIEKDLLQGVKNFLLFTVPSHKQDTPTNFDFSSKVVKKIKETFGDEILLACDICVCAFTSSGHCGVLTHDEQMLDNAKTLDVISNMALKLAAAGSDMVAPSDMSDGRIAAIRDKLDENGLEKVLLMSYSSKFHSSLYGPFRDVCNSKPGGKSPMLKDRSTYQIDPANKKDALLASYRDEMEGADILMVKPASLYLDIVHEIAQSSHLPLAIYHVSGEYAAIELMAKNGLADRDRLHFESWTAFHRAGANIIISYAAREVRRITELF